MPVEDFMTGPSFAVRPSLETTPGDQPAHGCGLVWDIHRVGTADDCRDCTWHVRLSFRPSTHVGLELARVDATGMAVDAALARVVALHPVSEWRSAAENILRCSTGVLAVDATEGQPGYLDTTRLTTAVIRRPPPIELARVVRTAASWGIGPTHAVARHFGVSTLTARTWLGGPAARS